MNERLLRARSPRASRSATTRPSSASPPRSAYHAVYVRDDERDTRRLCITARHDLRRRPRARRSGAEPATALLDLLRQGWSAFPVLIAGSETRGVDGC
jgi:hypothetical protein